MSRARRPVSSRTPSASPAQALWFLLREAPARDTAALLALTAAMTLSEGIGLFMLAPLLDVLSRGPEAAGATGRIIAALDAVGIGHSLGALLLIFLALLSARLALQYAQRLREVRYQNGVVDRLRLQCFEALQEAEWRWLSMRRASDHASILVNDINRVGSGFSQVLALSVTAATLVIYLGSALILSWKVASLAIVGGALAGLLTRGLRRRLFAFGGQVTRTNHVLQGHVQEGLSGIRQTRILGGETARLRALVAAMKDLRAHQIGLVAMTAGQAGVLQAAGGALLVLMIYGGVVWWNTPLPQLLAVVFVFARLTPLLGRAMQQYHQWVQTAPAFNEAMRLLADSRAAAEPAAPEGPTIRAIGQGIALRDVSLTYAGRSRPALAGVTFEIPARKTTAIIGRSGAGKSSLADLLMGLLEADSGELSVDGVTIAGARRRTWRRSTAYVQQDAFLFHDSLRNNLLMARPDATDEDLRRVLALASADFVFDFPEGLDAMVGDSGVRLSGGERQRLALARALLGEPALLILDEATSALDEENEAAIRQAIAGLRGDLTIVVIGHRLAQLDGADQVLCLRQGRVAAQGSWSEVRKVMGDALPAA